MGNPVSKETIYKYVIENYEVAYNYSDTFYDFKNYFRKHALDNGINLDNEINDESLNEVLDCLIDNFKIRKKKDNESKERIKRLSDMIEENKKNNLRKEEIMRRRLEMEKLERNREWEEYREMHENLLQKYETELKRNEIANKNREENLLNVIYELQEQKKELK